MFDSAQETRGSGSVSADSSAQDPDSTDTLTREDNLLSEGLGPLPTWGASQALRWVLEADG